MGIAPIPVSPRIAVGYDVENPLSLFGYLGQIRLAYMMGADLAALAMCRTVTEILFRRHYNNDKSTELPTLIKSTQGSARYWFMRGLNIVDGVDIAAGVVLANHILHAEVDDIPNKKLPEELVEGWTRVLAVLIREAPPATRR